MVPALTLMDLLTLTCVQPVEPFLLLQPLLTAEVCPFFMDKVTAELLVMLRQDTWGFMLTGQYLLE